MPLISKRGKQLREALKIKGIDLNDDLNELVKCQEDAGKKLTPSVYNETISSITEIFEKNPSLREDYKTSFNMIKKLCSSGLFFFDINRLINRALNGGIARLQSVAKDIETLSEIDSVDDIDDLIAVEQSEDKRDADDSEYVQPADDQPADDQPADDQTDHDDQPDPDDQPDELRIIEQYELESSDWLIEFDEGEVMLYQNEDISDPFKLKIEHGLLVFNGEPLADYYPASATFKKINSEFILEKYNQIADVIIELKEITAQLNFKIIERTVIVTIIEL